jgi:PilZ domain-containing protein
VTTLLIYARPDLEADLCHTLFWRDDLERYVADREEEVRMLALTTEPHVVVMEWDMPAVEEIVGVLRRQSLPHPVSIVALSHVPAEEEEAPEDGVDAVLSLPSISQWDGRLDQLLQMPTRKEARFDIRFDVETMLRQRPGSHRGLVLNISAGGLLIESSALNLKPGDDVALNLPLPGQRIAVEGRARVVRTPVEEHLGLRFEAFAGNGDERVRAFLASLAAQQPARH